MRRPTRRAVLAAGAAATATAASLPFAPAAAVLISDLGLQIRQAITQYLAADEAINGMPDDQLPAANARFDAASARLDELAEQLPSPPRSIADIVSRAEIAWCLADKDADGGLLAFSSDWANPEDVAAAQLVEAVLQFAGVRHG